MSTKDAIRTRKRAEVTTAWEMIRLYAEHSGYGSIPSISMMDSGYRRFNRNHLHEEALPAVRRSAGDI